jgi:hypothetical protein
MVSRPAAEAARGEHCGSHPINGSIHSSVLLMKLANLLVVL